MKDISVYATPELTLHGVQYVSLNIERRERADIFNFKKLLPKNWLVFISFRFYLKYYTIASQKTLRSDNF